MKKSIYLGCGGAFLLLAACGGSGSGDLINNDPVPSGPATPLPVVLDNTLPIAADSDAASSFAFALANLDGIATTGEGVLARGTSRVTADGLTGTYDEASDRISLDGGGLATLSNIQDFSAALLVESADGTRFGVFGVTPTQVPTGAVTYAGTTQMSIVDVDGAYKLTGDMTAVFDLSASFNDLEVTIDNLSGSRTDAFGQPLGHVDNVAVITLDVGDVNVDGTYSSTSGVSLTSGQLTTGLSGNETVTHNGSFFGVSYDELGGVFVIDDGTTGSLQVSGTYLGD